MFINSFSYKKYSTLKSSLIDSLKNRQASKGFYLIQSLLFLLTFGTATLIGSTTLVDKQLELSSKERSIPNQQIQKTVFTYSLGSTKINVLRYSNDSINNKLTYFVPHTSETTAFESGLNAVKTYGGSLVTFDNREQRNITFKLKGKKYTFNPNTIFSLSGAEKNLKSFGSYSIEAASIVYSFSKFVAGILNNSTVISLHNIHNETYSVKSYLGSDGKPIPGVRAVTINEPRENPSNFIYTTNGSLYTAAVEAGFNAVLQALDNNEDGMFWNYAMRNNIDFSFVEDKIIQAPKNRQFIAFINRFYNQEPLHRNTWTPLKRGDLIDLVAPASSYPREDLLTIKKIIESYGFKVRTTYASQKIDPLNHSNTDTKRLELLLKALRAKDSKAVWCIRGGEGSSNFLTQMIASPIPMNPKPIIGFSDITGIHLLINSKWNWPSIHGVLAEFNEEAFKSIPQSLAINKETSIKSIIDLLTDSTTSLSYSMQPMNASALASKTIHTRLIGGNLTLVTTSLDTPYCLTNSPRTLILEDIGDSPHQLERLFDQIAYSESIHNYDAIILGDFIKDYTGEPNSKIIQKEYDLILRDFAQKTYIPVFRLSNFGAGPINNPLPLNTKTKIITSGGTATLILSNR